MSAPFDYLYPPDEPNEITIRAAHMAESANEVHLVYNNKSDYAKRTRNLVGIARIHFRRFGGDASQK